MEGDSYKPSWSDLSQVRFEGLEHADARTGGFTTPCDYISAQGVSPYSVRRRGVTSPMHPIQNTSYSVWVDSLCLQHRFIWCASSAAIETTPVAPRPMDMYCRC
jgi:hypothetical protein